MLPTSDPGHPPMYMPANTSIILATVLTHRDEAIWGGDAEEFNIDRWARMGKEREAFTSWNIGPRMVSVQGEIHVSLVLNASAWASRSLSHLRTHSCSTSSNI